MEIVVYYKNNYCNLLCYPYCKKSKTFVSLTGYRTLSNYHLSLIKDLGYKITEIPLGVAEGV